jgi:hypothetical protein
MVSIVHCHALNNLIRTYRMEIKVYLQQDGTRKVERILILLVESVFVYCAIWVSSG